MKNSLKIFLVVVVAASILFPGAYVSAVLQHIPVVNSAGSQHPLFNGAQHSHSGASVTDVDGDLTGYSWQFLSCPGGLGACPALSQANGSISGGSSISVPGPTYTPNAVGDYTLLLTTTDALGQTNALGWGDSKGGMVIHDSGSASSDLAFAITIDASRNIYVAGQKTSSTSGYDWVIRKYTSTGQLDTTWGSSGMVTYDSGIGSSTDVPYAIAIDSSNNIYVAGRKHGAGSNPYTADWVVRKYTSTGQLDTTWGSSGMVTYDSGSSSSDVAFAIAIDSSRNVYVAGQKQSANTDWAVRKYTSTGQLDTTWGSSGMVTYNTGISTGELAAAVTVDSSKNIYVAGRRNSNGGFTTGWAVRKYTSTGQLDTTWGSSGMVTYDSGIGTNYSLPTSINIDSSKNIYVAGYKSAISGYDWAVRKYTSTGQLATTWGSSGMVTYDSGGSSQDKANAIVIDSSNNIYVTGQKFGSNYDWAIRKYTSTGQLDTAWGSSGMVTYDSGKSDISLAITVDVSSNIYATGYKGAGTGFLGTGTADLAVRKYLANGTLDNDPLLADIIEQAAAGAYGNIIVQATLDGNPWPSSGSSAVIYTLSGPSGNISNSSVPFPYANVAANVNYTLNYISGGPAGTIINPINPIAPVSSQLLPSGASISFTFNFVSANICGNGVVDAGEDCDGADLGGETCSSRGFSGGTLSCNVSTCQFDLSQCTLPPDFNLYSLNSDSLFLTISSSGPATSNAAKITVVPLPPCNCFDKDVTLSLVNIDPAIAGAVGYFSDPVLSKAEYDTGSAFSITVPPNTPSGQYTATIHGETSSLSPRSLYITLNISVRDPGFKEVLRPIYEKLAKTKSYIISNVFSSF